MNVSPISLCIGLLAGLFILSGNILSRVKKMEKCMDSMATIVLKSDGTVVVFDGATWQYNQQSNDWYMVSAPTAKIPTPIIRSK